VHALCARDTQMHVLITLCGSGRRLLIARSTHCAASSCVGAACSAACRGWYPLPRSISGTGAAGPRPSGSATLYCLASRGWNSQLNRATSPGGISPEKKGKKTAWVETEEQAQ
jgi:hypothetical protein